MYLLFLQQFNSFRFFTKTIEAGTQTKNSTTAPIMVIVGFNPAKTREIYISLDICINDMMEHKLNKTKICIVFTCRFRSLFAGGGNTGNSRFPTILL